MDNLHGRACEDCGFQGLPPEFACPACGSEKLTNVEYSGQGEIYTYTIVSMGFGHLARRAPYVLAVVELKEGPRLTTVIEGLAAEVARVGLPVRFSHHEAGTGPIFVAA